MPYTCTVFVFIAQDGSYRNFKVQTQ